MRSVGSSMMAAKSQNGQCTSPSNPACVRVIIKWTTCLISWSVLSLSQNSKLFLSRNRFITLSVNCDEHPELSKQTKSNLCYYKHPGKLLSLSEFFLGISLRTIDTKSMWFWVWTLCWTFQRNLLKTTGTVINLLPPFSLYHSMIEFPSPAASLVSSNVSDGALTATSRMLSSGCFALFLRESPAYQFMQTARNTGGCQRHRWSQYAQNSLCASFPIKWCTLYIVQIWMIRKETLRWRGLPLHHGEIETRVCASKHNRRFTHMHDDLSK